MCHTLEVWYICSLLSTFEIHYQNFNCSIVKYMYLCNDKLNLNCDETF